MSEIVTTVKFPLDDENFFRRECSFCREEFKIQLSNEELTDLANKGFESFLTNEESKDDEEQDEDEVDLFCPYCGQQAQSDHWWTQEQLSYLRIYAKNIAAKIINEQLIKPIKRNSNKSSSDLFSINFESKEMKYQEPWISKEVNDMDLFGLPCCEKKIKIKEEWKNNVYCFYCGFEHRNNLSE
jgi:hypothetical protein